MVTRMYTVFDKVAQEAGPIFNAKNDGVAMRSYLALLKETKDQGEYKLMCLGSFENESMSIVLLPDPIEVMEMTEVED